MHRFFNPATYAMWLWFLLPMGTARLAADTGFQSLRMGADARTGSMAMSGTAMAYGSAALFWNPAGLALRQGGSASFSWQQWFQDVQAGAVGFAWTGDRRGVGLHILYAGADGIEHRIVPSSEPIGTFSWNEFAAGVSYAERYGRLIWGATLKLLYQKLFVEDAWGAAVDLGVLYQIKENGLRIGAAVVNTGRMQELKEESSPLPSAAKVGAALPFVFFGLPWEAALDGVLEKGEPFHLQGGLECGLFRRLFLRSGYQTRFDNRGFAFGMGMAWNRSRLDYGFQPFRSGLGDSHRFTLSIDL